MTAVFKGWFPQVVLRVLKTLSREPESQNHAWVKEPFKVQDRPMDFNVTEYKKFLDMVSKSL